MMKKTMLRLFTLCLVSLLITGGLLNAQQMPRKKITLDISFNIKSITKIILEPETILRDVNEFWKTDAAFQLSKKWHQNTNVPIEMDVFKNNILKASKTPKENRPNNPYLVYAREIKAKENQFIQKAIPLICSYLPANGLNMATKVHITGYTKAYGFMTHTQIVVDAFSPIYRLDLNFMLNSILHETYHIGYGINRTYRIEDPTENPTCYMMLDALHNEGLASYVAYKAQSLYPRRDFKDYVMLENMETVKQKIKDVNEIFSQADTLPDDKLRKLSWEKGVMGRAYYVAGPYMCKIIEETKGREALVNTIVQGPRYFVSYYNSLVEKDKRIMEFPAPRKRSVYSRMFTVLKEKDDAGFALLADELAEMKPGNKNAVANNLNRLGYKLIHFNRIGDSIKVFQLAVKMFPKNGNLYDSLGEAYMKNGETAQAIKHYKKSLELAPDNTNAVKILKILESGK